MKWGKLGGVKQCQAIKALDSRDCSEVPPLLAMGGTWCSVPPFPVRTWAWGSGKWGNNPESTPSSCMPSFHIGFILRKAIFYEWMQIFLSSLQLSLGEFLAGGLVRAARCRNAARAHRIPAFMSSHRSGAVQGKRVRHVELEWVKTFREYKSIHFFSFIWSFFFSLLGFLCCLCLWVWGF